MPTFEIPDGPTTVKLGGGADPKATRTGAVVFNVTNKSGEVRAGRLSVEPTGQTKAEWFTLEGEREREFAPGETQTASVKIGVPPDVAPGDYPFRLRAVAVNDPDNDHADGPVATATVGGATTTKTPPWVWIVAALVVLVVIGGGAYFLLRPKPEPVPTPTPSPTPTSTPSPSPSPTEAAATVPDLKGKTRAEATAAAEGFDVAFVDGSPTTDAPLTVVSQSPPPGERLSRGFPIKATMNPGVIVPRLTGNTDAAVRALAPLGLHVSNSVTRCQGGGSGGNIISQRPAAGTAVAANSGVVITVRASTGFPNGRPAPRGKGLIDGRFVDCGRLFMTPLTIEMMPRARTLPARPIGQ